ncbi:MAG TPA: UPF0182 family protein, partial [Vicinamibacterales bacterium]|nr:UPF0182 family protein [Vicinamibacterales bacterium]
YPRMAFRRLPILVLLLLLVTGLPAFAEFYTDWLWFREVGYEQVFVRSLSARATIGLLTGAAVLAVLFLNMRLALRTLRRRDFTLMTPEGPRTISVDTSRIRSVVYLVALLAAGMIGLYSGSRWETWLYYFNAVPFGRVDPVLGRDISFYLFSLPLYEHLYGLAFITLLLTTAGVVAAHVVAGNLAFDPVHGFMASRPARRHVSLLVAGVFLVLAVGAWLGIPQLMTSAAGVVAGATYVDVNARMPAYALLAVAAVASAALAIYQSGSARLWPIAAGVGLYVVVALGGSAYAAIIQRFVVAPNEQVRETPYIINNITATRDAFALDRVEERPLSGEASLTRDDLERNAATIENVPLWNDQPLLDTFGQIQEIRTYYDFVSVDNDRYTINGKYRQIMLSARELNSTSLPSRTWINERLTFTHGYGLTLGPVNEVTPEGLPVLFIRDLPPASNVDLQVAQPAIYYGELPNDHVFVRTGTEEFDYPRGEDNVFTSYDGEGGVAISGLLRRLMFAIRFRSTDTFFSPNLTRESRVMINRRIADRVSRIAPFLSLDPDPYLAIADGRLVWIQDAYTTSRRYPYASSMGGVNYIRNSIKVTIDAYHGTTRFHLLDTDDPVAATIGRVFPVLFTPLDEMPGDLRSRLRYPQLIFSMQTIMFATFHMTNPAIFYNREDQWEIPAFDVGGQSERMHPYYTIMKLPGEKGPEYIQMLPFTPRQKDNLAAWMVARSDGDNYGRLVVFQFPKQTVIFGPRQIAARISQDQVISPQITLWNQQGSEVIQGTLLVIPIEGSLIYIRPLYLRAANGRIPELKRVIVAYQNQIVMEDTLDQSLQRIFPEEGRRAQPPTAPTSPAVEPGPPIEEVADLQALAAQARAHYDRAIRAQREGNWSLYGEELKRLGEVLEKLARRQQR